MGVQCCGCVAHVSHHSPASPSCVCVFIVPMPTVCGREQEVDLSANDITKDGVQRIREILGGLATAGSCRINLEDNDDDSDSDGGSDD